MSAKDAFSGLSDSGQIFREKSEKKNDLAIDFKLFLAGMKITCFPTEPRGKARNKDRCILYHVEKSILKKCFRLSINLLAKSLKVE